MTLADGTFLISRAINVLWTPLPFWDTLSIMDFLIWGMFFAIISGFLARLINKKYQELSMRAEDRGENAEESILETNVIDVEGRTMEETYREDYNMDVSGRLLDE